MKKILYRLICMVMTLAGYLVYGLQVFATQTTGTESLSAENKTFYDMTLIDEASPKLVHDQFGQKRPIPAGSGKTIEFRKFSPLPKATEPLTEGVTPNGSSLTVTAVTATVSQYGDFVALSDVLQLTAIDPILVETVQLLGNQAGATLDTVVRNTLQSGTNVMYCPSKAALTTEVTSRANLSADSELTVDMVKRAVTKLKRQNAKPVSGNDYVAIVHPDTTYSLTTDPQWEEWNKYANPETMFEGEIGRIFGCRFVETTEAKIYTGEGCPEGLAVYGTLFLGANAYGVTEITGGGLKTIIKQLGSAGSADPLDQRSTAGWKAIKVAKILVENFLVRVESCSKVFSATATAN